MSLRLDWCSHAAAKFACENWHYSKSMPGADSVKVGAWEDGKFIGCVIFSRGATPHIASPFGLKPLEVCELTRVALTDHIAPVSRILSVSIRFLKNQCPGLRLIVSFADTEQSHHGGIYQATNWVYIGMRGAGERSGFIVKGRKMHPKSVHSSGWKQSLSWLRQNIDPKASETIAAGKHKYVMPLDTEMRDRIKHLALPYPKRDNTGAAGVDSDTLGNQPGIGGAEPTAALHPPTTPNTEAHDGNTGA